MGEKIKDICKICKKCSLNPEDYWQNFPEGCLLAGRNFIKRENDMKLVRQAKEELLNYQILKKNNPENLTKIIAKEKSLLSLINKYKIYGSENW